jgi:hypothetical protein
MNPKLLPTVLAIIDLGAAVVYATHSRFNYIHYVVTNHKLFKEPLL